MLQNFKSFMMMSLVAILGLSLQSCDEEVDEPKVTVYDAPTFKATNSSVIDDNPLTAYGNKTLSTITYNVTITVNGVPQTITGTYSSNQLPVMVGNEVEIEGTFDQESATTYICFTMPDGSKEVVSQSNPVCKWIVPADFKVGDEIVAQWADNSGKIQHESLSSSITLIKL